MRPGAVGADTRDVLPPFRLYPGRRPLAIMLEAPHAEQPQSAHDTPADPATIRRLQRLLAEAIYTRENALGELQRTREQLAEANRHWFVAGADGYCQACGLPESNRARHAPRQAVA